MAANFSLVRLETLFLQMESTLGTIPNTTGVATLAGSNACRLLPGSALDPDVALIVRQDKTGSRSQTVGVPGRKFATWSLSMSMAGSGAPGTAPDCDPILQCAFGQSPSVSAGTSVAYTLSDSIPSMDIWDFRDPAGLSNRVSLGSVCTEVSWDFGGDIGIMSASGEGLWLSESIAFSGYDSTQKGGLTTFPTKPATPLTNGNATIGFVGSISLDGQTYTTLRSGKITLRNGNVIVKDQFGSFYGSMTEGDLRNVGITFSVYDDDTANLTALKAKAIAKTGVTLIITIGTTSGGIWRFTLSGVQLSYKYVEAGRRYAVDFTGTAFASTGTAKDEIALLCT